MRTAKVKDNGPVNIGFVELNHDRQDEQKGIRNGVTGERQGLSGEVELRINEDVDVVYDDQVEAVQVQEHAQSVQQKQQLSHVPVICWERFLPLRSLKVLLVEDDDSTRQLVCALLRNCGYEVTTVANGVQAWKVLTDLTTRINLVLTEVVMPGLSGIGLLSKIMSHKTCKNIPVIMTSSHDSMHVVFKCLSKGAVDYLLKPIRKNELKNLWQHVWRKCHSSSGSGSQSGIQTQKSSKLRSVEDSGNVSGSNDENDIRSISFNVQDGSDNGSGTQSSRTKRAVEVDCPKLPRDQLVDLPDSTCAGVIHSRPEASDNNWVPLTATKEYKGQDDELELEMGLSKIPNVQLEESSKEPVTDIAGGNKDKASDMNTKKDAVKVEKRQPGLNNEKPSGDTSNQAADLMGVMSTGAASQTERIILDIPKGLPKVSETKDKNIYDVEDLPSLELSLKRLGDVGDARTSNHERDILRHSKLSAFRRYDSASTSNQAPTGNVGSCSPPNNSSEVAKTESVQNLQSNSNSTFPYQCSHSSSNNNDRGSTTNSAFTKPAMIHNKPAPKSTAKCLHPASTFQPMQNGHLSPAQSITQGNNDAAVAKTMMSQAGGMDHQIQLSHHCYYYHHYYVHNMPQHQHQRQQLANGDASLRSMAAEAPHYGSFNMLAAPTEGYGQSGSSNASNARGKNLESDDVTGGEGEADGGIGFRSSDLNPLAKREAALNKFRQKRKERCFEKKVRYQSRKKLAEQRPRVRGQFVRRTVQENRMKRNHSETDPAVSGISKKRFAAAVSMERSVHNSMTHKTWAFSDQVVEPLQSETLFSTSVDSIKTP